MTPFPRAALCAAPPFPPPLFFSFGGSVRQVAEGLLADLVAAHGPTLNALPAALSASRQVLAARAAVEAYHAANSKKGSGAAAGNTLADKAAAKKAKGTRAAEAEAVAEVAANAAAEAASGGGGDYSLGDLCQAGLGDGAFASRAFSLAMAELKAQGSVPVLLALDEYNALFEDSHHFFASANIPPERLTLVRALRQLAPSGTEALAPVIGGTDAAAGDGKRFLGARGVVIGAESNRHPRCAARDYFATAGKAASSGAVPEALGVKRVVVGNLSRPEFTAVCDFMAASDVLNADSAHTRGLLMARSQANAKALVERIMLS